jgi:hypothetical protein
MTLTLKRLREAVAKDAAIRRVQKLQPVGGPGDKIFPATYPGERSTDPARHAFETRRIDGKDVRCVLIDSVQSQANRLEEALLSAMRAGDRRLLRVCGEQPRQRGRRAAEQRHELSPLELIELHAPPLARATG